MDSSTLNLLGSAISLVGSLNSLRRASGIFAKLQAGLGLVAAAYFLKRALDDR